MQRFASLAWICALTVAGGCTNRQVAVAVQQPIEFPHRTHVSYFSSGQHRSEKIKMHLDIFSMTEPPQELAEGRCVECHDDLAERTACAGCHVAFQNTALRNQKEIRPCVACHRGVWAASHATIPSATVCLTCHERGARLARNGESAMRLVLVRLGEPPAPRVDDIAWVRINALPSNVYFSHTAHVQFAAMPCTTCHQDVRTLTSPPSMVRLFTMSECLGCHARRGVSTDCLTCHK